jgi:hypothetical protein
MDKEREAGPRVVRRRPQFHKRSLRQRQHHYHGYGQGTRQAGVPVRPAGVIPDRLFGYVIGRLLGAGNERDRNEIRGLRFVARALGVNADDQIDELLQGCDRIEAGCKTLVNSLPSDVQPWEMEWITWADYRAGEAQ